eukprot:5689140-Amphidinium_carterae.1
MTHIVLQQDLLHHLKDKSLLPSLRTRALMAVITQVCETSSLGLVFSGRLLIPACGVAPRSNCVV